LKEIKSKIYSKEEQGKKDNIERNIKDLKKTSLVFDKGLTDVLFYNTGLNDKKGEKYRTTYMK
jgi:hypothetical protein